MLEPEQRHSVYLAFDFGLKRIGVAVGQRFTNSANPLPPLSAHQGHPDWPQVQALITTWCPAALVVGIPVSMKGEDLSVTQAAKIFAMELEKRYALPVHGVDERLTTKEARQQIFEEGGYKALQKISIDSWAAKLILEGWFNDVN